MMTPGLSRLRRALLLCAAVAAGVGCSKEPGIRQLPAPEEPGNSIAYVKSLYRGQPYRIDAEIYLRAQIISSDRTGNFSKSLILEDATGGIEVKLDLADIFREFPPGHTLVVQCNSLTIGSYGGALQLGAMPTGQWETDLIPADRIKAHLALQTGEEEELLPRELTIGSLTQRYVNCLARFEEVQFIDEEYQGDWGDPSADVDRHLVDRQGDTLVVRISRNADFANAKLPSGSGRIEGVLGYFNGRYQLRPVSRLDQRMNQPRFTPALRQ